MRYPWWDDYFRGLAVGMVMGIVLGGVLCCLVSLLLWRLLQ